MWLVLVCWHAGVLVCWLVELAGVLVCWSGSVGLAQLGFLAWLGLAWHGMAWHGMAGGPGGRVRVAGLGSLLCPSVMWEVHSGYQSWAPACLII